MSALALIGSAGLGRAVSLSMRLLSLPGMRNMAVRWFGTPLGAQLWVSQLEALLIAGSSPSGWRERMHRMARTPGFLEAVAATTASGINLRGQREVLLGQLSKLTVPTLILWGKGTGSFRCGTPGRRSRGSFRDGSRYCRIAVICPRWRSPIRWPTCSVIFWTRSTGVELVYGHSPVRCRETKLIDRIEVRLVFGLGRTVVSSAPSDTTFEGRQMTITRGGLRILQAPANTRFLSGRKQTVV